MKDNLVFIIEDDDDLGDIFSKSLEGLCAKEIIKDGIVALKRLEETTPRLILLDLNLPGIGGEKILESIRSNPALGSSHVIVCTANARKAELLRDDADVVLLKPVNPVQLRQIVSRFLTVPE
jgi:CheY-like chemotaxis protein